MALVSPGVEVTIIDESQYLPAPTNSVPLIVLATAQNKANASGTGVASATTAANANKLYQVTSQRDLVNLYGKPFFYSTTNGTPIQGYELNEYGLLAAYSLLGVTNRCYVLRADIDLASLVGQTSRPTGAPANGTYWLDSLSSTWGIYEFNATTGQFALQEPIVITDTSLLSSGTPLNSIGNIGDYAVVALERTGAPTDGTQKTFFFKTPLNQWVPLGGASWRFSIPTIQAANSGALTAGNTFTIGLSGLFSATITVPLAPNNNPAGVAAQINSLGWSSIYASADLDGKLQIFSSQIASSGNPYVTIGAGTGTVLTDMGIVAKNYYQPIVRYGSFSQMPLWSESQTTPRPTGSVWIKLGATGDGLNADMNMYSTATNTWLPLEVPSHTSDWAAIASIDPTGGKAIPEGTLYGQVAFGGALTTAPYYIWKRIATGPTTVVGSNTNPIFNDTTCVGPGPYSFTVYVSVPGSASLSAEYTVTIADGSDATDFVTAWAATGIPYTNASVADSGAIVLTHTAGGVIILNDHYSSGVVTEAGFEVGNLGVKYGPARSPYYSNVAQTSTSGVGLGAEFNVVLTYGNYVLVGSGVAAGGTGYVVGDTIVINGASLGGEPVTNDLTLVVTEVGPSGAVTGVTYSAGSAVIGYSVQLSNWVEFNYTANEGAPVAAPASNSNWFYSVVDEVDIMVNYNGQWHGYKNLNYDSNGFPTSGVNTTNPTGPIVSASEPTTQTDGTPLVYGDLWIDTSDLENYPVIYRWQAVNGAGQWVLIDNTNQTGSNGVVFADARWSSNQNTIDPINDPMPTIVSLLTSNNVDLDAPSPSLYPSGMLLFNTRRSGYNVKQYRTNYFTNANFPGEVTPAYTNTWVSVSGNQSNGAAYMGRKAQRAMVVQALRSAIDTNTEIRDEDNYFNLIASPNYPEMQPNMVVLNADRGETAYIIGDTPLGLADSATDIQAWANNYAGATSTGEEGCVTRNTYLGLFYPSGIANDLDGNEVVVPASHMMLRTFLRNDTIAYPWLAAAGTRRGNIDNALNIGYLNRATGEFQSIKTRIGIRDVLYINQINPLVFFTGIGLLNYGNKNSFNSQSALDRTNVARLVNYVRRQLTVAARPFVFEPNDQLTRQQIAGVVQTLMVDLVAKRGIYDYLVVCDESNNTPARIDRNELWVDVAIEPVKAVEFIYIPVRILNTGEIAAQG